MGARRQSVIFTEPYRRFLKNLRAAREHAGLTQTEVGTALGVGQSDMAARERGSRRIDAFELVALSKLYDVAIEELIPEKTLRGYLRDRRRGK